MIARKVIAAFALLLLASGLVGAADLTGKWTSEFESQIGPQKYTFEFKADGDKLTGKSWYEHSMGKGENTLTKIKVVGDEVSFVETLSFDGNEIIVTYRGKFVGDEVKLTRTVGDFGVEEIVLKRAKTPSAHP